MNLVASGAMDTISVKSVLKSKWNYVKIKRKLKIWFNMETFADLSNIISNAFDIQQIEDIVILLLGPLTGTFCYLKRC